MGGRLDSILDAIGRTPVIRINRLAPDGAELWVKVEGANPLGSVKDRLALGVIEAAERSGELSPGQTVIEATSGNTGIGLAMVCAAKGYPLVVTMAENFSVERRKIMRFLGARVVLTPSTMRGLGMLAKAEELAEKHGWFLCRQFENEANADVHSRTTAREILEQFAGEPLDYWVTGFGTGGTLKGVARVLRHERPATQIVVCEPDNSPMLQSGVRQPRRADGTPVDSHPSFRTHLVQGWAPDFIPKLTEDVVDAGMIDRIVSVNSGDAVRSSRELACKEGIFTGISGGATFAGAVELCRSIPRGSTVLCMLPDTAERYLSTPLFDDIAVEMTEEEIEIARSTPNYRFDVCPAPTRETAPRPLTPEAVEFVARTISAAGDPVVVFALEWCEFCWSVRKLLDRCGVSYRLVELDSAEYLRDDWGGRVRAALLDRTSSRTLPQVFVGGEYVGGCTELFDAYASGDLQTRLDRAGVGYDRGARVDPHSLLPAWLHPR
ncbi:MAG TPA: pyridoxal-phosphate dependent enzyme [Candidatus Polarisedimenticolaceae bacterium]|nr:pyridoxal-phosphate dependent enzyme [Candidatus Polarisedimenticolaceae bacterium]